MNTISKDSDFDLELDLDLDLNPSEDFDNSSFQDPDSDKNFKKLKADFLTTKQPRFQAVPLLVVVLLALNFFASCSARNAALQARKMQPYIYVHNPDGSAIQSEPQPALYRPEATIKSFAENFIRVGFTWTPESLNEDQQSSYPERGVQIPTSLYYSSFALQPGFREEYLQEYIKRYSNNFNLVDYLNGSKGVDVKIFGEPRVQQVAEGVWDVTVVATRIHHSNNEPFANEVFNHVLRVQAIKPSENIWGERSSFIGGLVHDMQKQGLQIIQITQF